MKIIFSLILLQISTNGFANCENLPKLETIVQFKNEYIKHRNTRDFHPSFNLNESVIILTSSQTNPNCAILLNQGKEKIIDHKSPVGIRAGIVAYPKSSTSISKEFKDFLNRHNIHSAVGISLSSKIPSTSYNLYLQGFHRLNELLVFRELFHNLQSIRKLPQWAYKTNALIPKKDEFNKFCYQVDPGPNNGRTFVNELNALFYAYEALYFLNSRTLAKEAIRDYLKRKELRMRLVFTKETPSTIPGKNLKCGDALTALETKNGIAHFVGFFSLFDLNPVSKLQFKNNMNWHRQWLNFSDYIGAMEAAVLYAFYPDRYAVLIEELEKSTIEEHGIAGILYRELLKE